MSLKLKVLSLSLVAAMALSAVAVMSASAKEGGHFVSDAATTHWVGTEGGTHNVHLSLDGFAGTTGCTTDNYTALTNATTVTSLNVTASYAGCTTTGTATNVPVNMNGCTYTFTVAGPSTENTEQTAHLVCPAGKSVVITHPNCTATVHPQTIEPTEATPQTITYTTTGNPPTTKHEITMDLHVTFKITRHGLCQIAGTNGHGTLQGSVTVKGFAGIGGPQVNITAT